MSEHRPLRVLQLIETGGPGGAETVFLQLTGALRKRGHAVHAIVGGEGWLAAQVRDAETPVECYTSDKAFDLPLIQLLLTRVRELQVDVIHTHLFGSAVYGGVAARLSGIPAIATLHGLADIAEPGWRLAAKRRVIRHSIGHLVTVSDALRETVDPLLRFPVSRQHVVTNGVAIADAPIRVNSRPAASVQQTIVAVGNIRPAKGYPGLLDAMAVLRHRLPDVRLLIAGQPDRGPLQHALEEQRAALGLDQTVAFLGFVDDPKPLLRDADCFVLASTSEGFSIATIEAMGAGIPVVATRSGGPERIIRDGETGLLVPVGDPTALANALFVMLTQPERAAAMAVAAAADVRTRYSMDVMVSAYEALYRAAIAARGK